VGCSAKEGLDEKYFDECQKLARSLAEIPEIQLVYGCCNKGIMGVFYKTFREFKRKVIGVLTKFYKEDLEEKCYDEVIVTNSTTERFVEIYKNSDVLLFLPGGIGTLSELFSAIEEKRIGNGKKIILYNYDFFYTPIIKELYKLHLEGFIDEVPADVMIIESDIEKIVELVKEEMK